MAGRGRHWPLEFVRGLAVIAMIFYHFMWDLSFLGLYPRDVTTGGWWFFARSTAVVFVLLVGTSIVFAGRRRGPGQRERAWLLRGGQLLALALGITAVTRVVLGDAFILFGVLHLVGVAMLLAPLLWRLGGAAPFAGAAIIWLGAVVRNIPTDTLWLAPLGVYPDGYPAVDYFPLIPWLGVVMTGMGVGLLLQRRLSGFEPEGVRVPRLLRPLVFAGRHSLLIYIVHQPLLLAGIWLFGYTVW